MSTKLAVALIFFLQGLSLATKQMLAGCRPARLHIFCLGWNFILCQALAGLMLWPLSMLLLPELRIGFWMLSILPTTIASAPALTASAEGAVPEAIFASVFSNVLAVFVVPVLAAAYLSTGSGVELPLLPIFGKLSLIVLLPLVAGQVFRRFFTEMAKTFSPKTRWLTQAAILFIVYVAFARSVESGFISSLSLANLISAIFSVLLLLFSSAFLVWRSSAWLRVESPQRTAAFFCASQKSLATGLPMLASILAVSPLPMDSALILIPLLLFHPLQLLVGAFCAGSLRKGFD